MAELAMASPQKLSFLILSMYAFALGPGLSAQNKSPALAAFGQARQLDLNGQRDAAKTKYTEAISLANTELAANARSLDAFAAKAQAQFRLNLFGDVITTGRTALAIAEDPRLIEVMGEAYFYLGDYKNCISYLQRYLGNQDISGERSPTAYFFLGEAYVQLKELEHASLAYALAVKLAPSIALWWLRYGQALEKLSDKANALLAYERVIALEPRNAEAKARSAALKTQG